MSDYKILIIDDDPTILEMFKLALTRAGYNVVTASDGEIGLTVFDRETPDLCLVDIAMPGMDGYQVIETIRGKGELGKTTPVIILTAHEQPVMRDYAQEMGVNLYLTKPVTPSNLIKQIKKLLEQAAVE